MKRFLVLLLVLCMSASLFACGKTSDTNLPDSTQSESGKDTTNPAQKEDSPDSTTPDTKPSDTMTEEMFNDPNFEDVVVVDNDNIRIVISGVHPEEERGCVVDIIYENKTQRNLTFEVKYPSIDGVGVSATLESDGVEDIARWKKLDGGDIKFIKVICDVNEIAELGIDKVSDLRISFLVHNDRPDAMKIYLEETAVHVYPYGKELATAYKYVPSENDQVLIDNDYMTFIVRGQTRDENDNAIISVCLINKTDELLIVYADDERVNDFEINPYFTETLPANTITFPHFKFNAKDLSKAEIENITSIKFLVRVGEETGRVPAYFEEQVEAIFN